MRSPIQLWSFWRLILILVVVSAIGVLGATAMAQAPISLHISPHMVETENEFAVAAQWIDLLAPENRTAVSAIESPLAEPLQATVTQTSMTTSTVVLTQTASLEPTADITATGVITTGVAAVEVAMPGITVTSSISPTEAMTGLEATGDISETLEAGVNEIGVVETVAATTTETVTTTAPTTATEAVSITVSTNITSSITSTASNAPVDSDGITVPFLRFRTNAKTPLLPVFMIVGEDQSALTPLSQVDQVLPLIALMVNASDVILVGERGMLSGQPYLECAGDLSLPLDEGAELTVLSAELDRYYAGCADFWQGAGSDLGGYNVREIAADVNQLREALGYEQIRLVGVDLGTQIGLEYIRDFGASVERALFALAMGPDQAMKLPADLQAQLVKLDQVVRADPVLSAQIPDFLGLVTSVLESLGGRTVTADIIDPLSGELVSITAGQLDLQYATAMALGGSEQFSLPAHYFAMNNGDFTWLAEQALGWRGQVNKALVPVLANCASGASAERRDRVTVQSGETLLGNAANGASFEICAPVALAGEASLDIGDEFRQPVVSDVPTLLISGGMDGHTPASNAEAVLDGLANGQHVVVTCGTHDLFEEAMSDLAPIMRGFMRGDPLAPLSTPTLALPCELEPVTVVPISNISWTGEYFNNRTVQIDATLVRADPAINFDWGEGSPDPSINPDNFSVRWTATPDVPAGTYRFSIWVDDGVRLWVDDVLVLDAWEVGPARNYIVDVNVVRGQHNVRFEYFEAEDNALAKLAVGRFDDYPDWRTEYFDSPDLAGPPVVSRNEKSINHIWGDRPPVPGLSGNGYSVRWERRQFLPAGHYRYDLEVSGGARLWVDGVPLIDDWAEISPRVLTAESQFGADGLHDIRVEYGYTRGNAAIRFGWEKDQVGVAPTAVIVGASRSLSNVEVAYDGATSSAADGSPLVAYAWEMGDGSTASGPAIRHVFGDEGVYNVTLTVTDDQGRIGRSTLQVRVDATAVTPPAESSGPVAVIRGPDQGIVGQVAKFDASASESVNPIVRFDWQFGDGTGANAVAVDKIYGAAGIYTVLLTVTDDQGAQSSASKYVQIFLPTPVPAGPATPTPPAPVSAPIPPTPIQPEPIQPEPIQPTPVVPTPVPVVPSDPGQPESPLPTSAPDYYVPPTAEIAAIVDNNPLEQVLNANGLPAARAPFGKTITFDATRSTAGSQPIQSYYWDFGDGVTTSSDPQVGLQYFEPGIYEVILVVQDAGNQTVDTILVVSVEQE